MKRWTQWLRNNRISEEEQKDKHALIQEIKRAHLEWLTAHYRFDYVIEKEQIDYAIFALEAAEKRYEMLIRQAKVLNMSTTDVCSIRALEAKGS